MEMIKMVRPRWVYVILLLCFGLVIYTFVQYEGVELVSARFVKLAVVGMLFMMLVLLVVFEMALDSQWNEGSRVAQNITTQFLKRDAVNLRLRELYLDLYNAERPKLASRVNLEVLGGEKFQEDFRLATSRAKKAKDDYTTACELATQIDCYLRT